MAVYIINNLQGYPSHANFMLLRLRQNQRNLKHQQKHIGTQIKKEKLSNRRREETEVPCHVVG